MKKILIYIEQFIIGRKSFQSFFSMLHRISLRGMYYNQAMHVSKSGEVFAMKYAEKKLGRKNKIIFDIGAHVGDWTYYANQIFSNSTIYVFEPSLKVFIKLKERLHQYNNILLQNHGLSDEQKEIKLYYSGISTATFYPKETTEDYEIINVDTLDNFCLKNNINYIDFLKIDVEGNELKVLNGCKTLLESNKIKYIQFEYGANSIESRVFLKDFVNFLHRYKLYRIVKNGIVEFSYNETYEIQLPHNILAELKE